MVDKVLKEQSRLIEEVISRGICVKCGACVGLCPYFHYFDGKVVVMDTCHAGDGRCLQVCPQANSPDTSPGEIVSEIGPLKKVIIARATDREIAQSAQYGGVVSALLSYGLDAGTIHSAVVTGNDEKTSPSGHIVRERSELLQCSGSRYSASGTLSTLNRAMKRGEEKLAVVGLPCQMEALSHLKKVKPDGEEMAGRIVLKIGLFCTWALDYRSLSAFLKKQGIQEKILKFDIPPPPSEIFQVRTDKGCIDFPLSLIRPMIQPGCELCRDMTSEQADISVGAVEGKEGWNMVVIRTDQGLLFFDEAVNKGALESEEVPQGNLEHLKEAAQNKRERGQRARNDRGVL